MSKEDSSNSRSTSSEGVPSQGTLSRAEELNNTISEIQTKINEVNEDKDPQELCSLYIQLGDANSELSNINTDSALDTMKQARDAYKNAANIESNPELR
ncbi:hypothetical protein N9W34_01905, partial [Rickettsiales bacterium]|nr:hypothetical protein [Rickettsiales bacterium]